MKRVKTALAFLLCLLLTVPACAVAEEASESYLRLTNPVITGNGSPLMDLTGLSAEIDCTKIGDFAGVMLKIAGGDQLALKGVAALNQEYAAFSMDGMTNVYGVKLSDLASVMGVNLQDSVSVIDSAVLEEMTQLMFAIITPFASFDASQYTTAAPDEEYDGVTYTRTDFAMDAETLDGLIVQVLEALDSSPSIQKAIAASGAIQGTLADAYKNSGVTTTLTGSNWDAGNGVNTFDYYLTFTNKNGETAQAEFYIDNTTNGDGSQSDTEINLFTNDEKVSGLLIHAATGANEKGDYTTVSLTGMNYTADAEGVAAFDLSFTARQSADGVNTLESTMSGGGSTLEINGSFTPGDTNVLTAGVSAYQGDNLTGAFALNATYQQNADQTGITGNVTLTVAASEDVEYGASFGVETGVATADSADYAIDTANMIDMMTMSSDDGDQFMSEIMAAVQNAATILSGTIPSLAALMG